MNTPTSSRLASKLPVSPAQEPSRPVQDQPTIDASSRIPKGERALVLGGGGSTGNAWLIGVVAGLYDAGMDVTAADLTIGTSAGATAAAQIAGATPPELFNATVDPATLSPRAFAELGSKGSGAGQGSAGQSAGQPAAGQLAPRAQGANHVAEHMERTRKILDAALDMADMRRRMGAAALDMAAAMEGASVRWRTTVASRLPQQAWPEGSMLLTAVDAKTGEPVVFDRYSGVDLADAVAASCASGFAYSIGSNQYIDGGYRTNAENADLAAGYPRVLVLSPFGGRTRTPREWGMHLEAQVEALRGSGSQVQTVYPDTASEFMFGVNAMDLSLRPRAARTGYEQGQSLAGELAAFWS
ncbi:patatin-like phospholipase family protein [Paenarthrobacter sp. NPDC089316]|uniref:patatin-like phospholipase family protein n=1 Tax=unclassified Paenarthrobacter TaxID=2634190 RepID=UPI00343CC21B